MNPVRYDDDGPAFRQVWCLSYNQCLDHAVSQEWPSFTCRGCMDYSHQEMSAADAEEDMLKCAELIKAIDAGRRTTLPKRTPTK